MFNRPPLTPATLQAARLGIVIVRYDAKGTAVSCRVKRLWRYLKAL